MKEVKTLIIDKKETQRQVPKNLSVTSNPLYTDTLYGYLQANCEIEGSDKLKLFPKEKLNYTKIGAALGLTRQTIAKKFKNLLDMGLVQERVDGYELITLQSNDAFLVSLSTLRKLVSAMKERTISCYVYLLNRYIANGEKPFIFTIDQLKIVNGMGTKTTSNNYIITDILDVLKATGLIFYSCSTERSGKTYKKVYKLDYATNRLPQ